MNAQEIIAALEELEISSEQLGHEDFDSKEVEAKLGKFDLVDNERINDDTWAVYHFIEHDVYLRIDGTYSSYEGSDFSDASLYEVVPKEKVSIVYERKK